MARFRFDTFLYNIFQRWSFKDQQELLQDLRRPLGLTHLVAPRAVPQQGQALQELLVIQLELLH